MPLARHSLSDYHYELPEALIAQAPLPDRDESRLLDLTGGGLAHRRFRELLNCVAPGDLLVVNDTRVIPARLDARKDSGGVAGILLERLLPDNEALCQVRVSKPLKAGRTLTAAGDLIEVLGREGEFYRLRFSRPALAVFESLGRMPLPPYIQRPVEPADTERYQTRYASAPGAVAAPTAGLHFTDALLDALADRGVARAAVTLHVGAGTFQPVRVQNLDEHEMHTEWYDLPATTVAAIEACRARGGQVVAVGTTVVRVLESAAAAAAAELSARQGETRLFIRPGFRFQVVDRLITNFHLPQSTLLMLVAAFAGYERIMHAYRVAVAERYRFFSYGDAMLLERDHAL